MKIEHNDNWIAIIKRNNDKTFPREMFFSKYISKLIEETTLSKKQPHAGISWENHTFNLYFDSKEKLTAWQLTYSEEIEEYEAPATVSNATHNNSLQVAQVIASIRAKMAMKKSK